MNHVSLIDQRAAGVYLHHARKLGIGAIPFTRLSMEAKAKWRAIAGGERGVMGTKGTR